MGGDDEGGNHGIDQMFFSARKDRFELRLLLPSQGAPQCLGLRHSHWLHEGKPLWHVILRRIQLRLYHLTYRFKLVFSCSTSAERGIATHKIWLPGQQAAKSRTPECFSDAPAAFYSILFLLTEQERRSCGFGNDYAWQEETIILFVKLFGFGAILVGLADKYGAWISLASGVSGGVHTENIGFNW